MKVRARKLGSFLGAAALVEGSSLVARWILGAMTGHFPRYIRAYELGGPPPTSWVDLMWPVLTIALLSLVVGIYVVGRRLLVRTGPPRASSICRRMISGVSV